MPKSVIPDERSQPRVAVVTGAGSGVGRAAALALLRGGWHVALAGRNPELLASVVNESRTASQTMAVLTDVRNSNEVDTLFQRAQEGWGRVDLLFNNAGIFAAGSPIEAVTDAQWSEVVETNLSGMFYCMRAAFRVMRAQRPQGGRIINNGSVSAHAPRPHSIGYTATKHAVTGLTKAGALDGRPYNIAVGQIDIGNAATPLAASIARGAQQANGEWAVEPMIDPELVGANVLHMANLPLNANVLFQTLMATAMPFVGRG